MSSVIQAARVAPASAPARTSFEIMSDVVEVNTKRSTSDPGETAASSRLSVPWTFTATKSVRLCVLMFGLCSAPGVGPPPGCRGRGLSCGPGRIGNRTYHPGCLRRQRIKTDHLVAVPPQPRRQ